MTLRLGVWRKENLAMGRIRQVGYAVIFNNKHSVLKVFTSLPEYPTATDREIKIYKHLTNINSAHPGQSLIRELYDSFDLQGPIGKHCCLVLQPMRMSLLEMMGLNSQSFDLPLLKMTVKRLLSALDFLHTEAEIIHCDLKTDNLMLGLEDTTTPREFAKAEAKNPSPRKKIDESRTVYKSRKFLPPFGGKGYGLQFCVTLARHELENDMSPAQSSNRIFIEHRRSYWKCRGGVLLIFGTWRACRYGTSLKESIYLEPYLTLKVTGLLMKMHLYHWSPWRA
ncbi:CMGC/SRPK protein kinase [Nannizzia gypsea CBS 118893]|uniref:non-specific serine/threonine protein kinase n=1 Tax=Arthroderma gypseum (strain ATCC MYA-4604 / CBS 118893) TaxID=535722 RepID=E4V5A8_ARTGP|nr:CMGC/SRPK protein kinase [Nannizzia gypsea CBS 118893]EFR05182.1 CMGC/SRPK protein kinase [Nannizzia gypsea CBS 118893]